MLRRVRLRLHAAVVTANMLPLLMHAIAASSEAEPLAGRGATDTSEEESCAAAVAAQGSPGPALMQRVHSVGLGSGGGPGGSTDLPQGWRWQIPTTLSHQAALAVSWEDAAGGSPRGSENHPLTSERPKTDQAPPAPMADLSSAQSGASPRPSENTGSAVGTPEALTSSSGMTVMDRTLGKDIYIPVPLYTHATHGIGEESDDIVKPPAHDWLDEAPANATGDVKVPSKSEGHQQAESGGHSIKHSYVALLFFFMSLVMGSAILMFLERFCPRFPYTCALFISGFLLSLMHARNRSEYAYTRYTWGTWFVSVDIWEHIDPHMLFYSFLPVLIFGEAMRLNVQLVTTCFWQVFLLACPGVILGTCLTASVAKCLLPYQWDWQISLVFGAILSATDPVAVVALFNTLGVSPRLTMLIAGESLLNDGTAIVIVVLMLNVALGKATLTPQVATLFFGHMTLTAAAFGALGGIIAVIFIGMCAEDHYMSDPMIQAVVTICCAYLVFFMAENEIKTSGVITTVTAGFIIAYAAWPRFVSPEAIRIVWETMDFIGNTVIFLLAGLIFGNCVLSRWAFVGAGDFGWLFLLYIAVTLIRAAMVLTFWVPLNLVGSRLRWQEGVVMVWSGLRGAVSLALAIIVDSEEGIDYQMGSRVMFHVGGIAALTFLLQSTTAATLVEFLGLTRKSVVRMEILEQFEKKMAEDSNESLKEFAQRVSQGGADAAVDRRFSGANVDIVRAMVPSLQEVGRVDSTPADKNPADATPEDEADRGATAPLPEEEEAASAPGREAALLRIYREVHLHVVQHHYVQSVEEGVLPRCDQITRILLHSTNEALDNAGDRLSDWQAISRHINMEEPSRLFTFLGGLVKGPPFSYIPDFASSFNPEFRTMRKIYVALCFLEAHAHARKEVPIFFGKESPLEVKVQEQVASESEQECKGAAGLLEQVPAEQVELGKSEMLSRKLLQVQMEEIESLLAKGLLKQSEADFLQQHVTSALRKIVHSPKASWLKAK